MSSVQSPMVLTSIQNNFIHQFTHGFATMGHYATNLFYLIATIEIVMFALFWAMKHEDGFALFILKIFKLSLIFFVISQFPNLLQALIDGFTVTSIQLTGDKAALALFNPSHIWDYGFDAGINMTKVAVTYGTTNVAMSNVYLILGFGSLMLFALIGAQIILIVTGFYVVSLLALLMMPLGAFFGTRNFFERAIESVFRMGARVFALMLVLGVASVIWAKFDLSQLTQTTTLTQPIGFFIATLVFVVLAYRLPNLAVEAVGQVRGRLMDEFTHTQGSSAASAVNVSSSANLSQVQSAATMSAPAVVTPGVPGASSVSNAATMSAPGSAAAPQATTVNVSTQAASGLQAGKNKKTAEGAELGISRETLSKLKSTFKQVMNESKK